MKEVELHRYADTYFEEETNGCATPNSTNNDALL